MVWKRWYRARLWKAQERESVAMRYLGSPLSSSSTCSMSSSDVASWYFDVNSARNTPYCSKRSLRLVVVGGKSGGGDYVIVYPSWTFTAMILVAHHNFQHRQSFSTRVGRREREALRVLYRDTRIELWRDQIWAGAIAGYRAVSIQDKMHSTSFFSTRTSMGLVMTVVGYKADDTTGGALLGQRRIVFHLGNLVLLTYRTSSLCICGCAECDSPNIHRRS
ncbi:hypothetical protein IW262DRAFT_206681 [Armillaria fumosa]|nr:hypothetical protein IW262DRAFT_206681 [Armillaria fumosa]